MTMQQQRDEEGVQHEPSLGTIASFVLFAFVVFVVVVVMLVGGYFLFLFPVQ